MFNAKPLSLKFLNYTIHVLCGFKINFAKADIGIFWAYCFATLGLTHECAHRFTNITLGQKLKSGHNQKK